MENPKARRSIARNWIQRNPRLFQSVAITTSLLILFSRPLYDAFIREDVQPAPQRLKK